MSVTGQLKDENSPLSRFFRGMENQRAISSFVYEKNRLLSNMQPIIIPDAIPTLVGTAFSYYFRWYMQPMDSTHLNKTVAGIGVQMTGLPNVAQTLRTISDNRQKATMCCLLALFEECVRSKKMPNLLKSFIADNRLLPDVCRMLDYDRQMRASIDDVLALGETIDSVFNSLEITKNNIISSPTFAGSNDIGGADAVMIVDGILFDVRCTAKRQPMTDNNLRQMISYVLLDYFDEYKITHCAWYYARQKALLVVPVEKVISNLESKRYQLNQSLMLANNRLLDKVSIVDSKQTSLLTPGAEGV